MLRDPAFRVALDYAVDRQKIAAIVYSGRATPGYTMITTNTWRDPDYHWEPPAGVKRPFDIAKANALLTAAGYPLKNGVRLNKQGKPITLRLWALSEATPTQAEGGLITGWFRQLGLKIVYQVVDNGVASDAMYAYKGNVPAPDYDMIIWFWDGYNDPGSTLQCFTTSQIGSWNEIYWSNAEFDKLCVQQGQELDAEQARAAHLPDAAGDVRAEPAERAHLLRLPAGRERQEVGRLDAVLQRQRPGVLRLAAAQLHQHPAAHRRRDGRAAAAAARP